jgi:iron complex outermembrane recepter protein
MAALRPIPRLETGNIMNMGSLLRASAFTLALNSNMAAMAEDSPKEMIIVTGTKSEFGEKSGIALEKLPQSVQVITSEDIVDRGATSIGDLLRTVPSANIGNSRVSRFQSFSLNVRGFLVDQMRNGIRQRYYEDVDASALSNVERIEVLKGPSAVLYGQSAVGGIVSIITKRPTDTFAASAAVTIGRDNQKVATFDVGGPVSKTLSIRVTGEIERSGTFVDFQNIDRDNLAVTLNWRPSDMVAAYLVAEYVERRTLSNPGLPVVGTVTSNGVARISRNAFLGEPAFSGLKADSPLLQAWVDVALGNGWAVTPRLQYSELNTPFTQLRILGVEPSDPTLIRRNGRVGYENDSYSIGQIDVSGTIKTGAIIHKLLIGYEYDRQRSIFIQSNFVNIPSIDGLNPNYLNIAQRPMLTFGFNFAGNTDGHALYLQDQVEIGRRLGLVLGVRHSWLSNDGFFSTDPTTFGVADTESPELTSIQAGASYQLGGGFSIFGGYNSGFDVENSFGGAPTVTGGRLQPETSGQFEAGIRYSSDTARFNASAFQIKRRDVAGDDPDNPGFSRNVGSFRVRGLELEGRIEPGEGLTLTAGYAYLAGRITASATPTEIGGRIADLARHSGNIRVAYDVPGTPFDVRAGLGYQGKRSIASASPILLDDIILVDLAMGAKLGQFRLDLVASNLFDKHYYSVAGAHQGNRNSVYPGDPRTVSLRLGLGL